VIRIKDVTFFKYHFNRLTLSKKTFEVIFFLVQDAWESCEQKQAGVMAPRIPDAAGAAGRRRPSITIQVRPANGVAQSGFAGSQKGPCNPNSEPNSKVSFSPVAS
jgi:hypothetical protein